MRKIQLADDKMHSNLEFEHVRFNAQACEFICITCNQKLKCGTIKRHFTVSPGPHSFDDQEVNSWLSVKDCKTFLNSKVYSGNGKFGSRFMSAIKAAQLEEQDEDGVRRCIGREVPDAQLANALPLEEHDGHNQNNEYLEADMDNDCATPKSMMKNTPLKATDKPDIFHCIDCNMDKVELADDRRRTHQHGNHAFSERVILMRSIFTSWYDACTAPYQISEHLQRLHSRIFIDAL